MASLKNKKQQEVPAESREGIITVKICDQNKGLDVYEKVNYIRVTSKKYNLLIMADYLPILGELEGSISFRDSNREYQREHVSGYFMHKNNEFSLLIKNESTEQI